MYIAADPCHTSWLTLEKQSMTYQLMCNILLGSSVLYIVCQMNYIIYNKQVVLEVVVVVNACTSHGYRATLSADLQD